MLPLSMKLHLDKLSGTQGCFLRDTLAIGASWMHSMMHEVTSTRTTQWMDTHEDCTSRRSWRQLWRPTLTCKRPCDGTPMKHTARCRTGSTTQSNLYTIAFMARDDAGSVLSPSIIVSTCIQPHPATSTHPAAPHQAHHILAASACWTSRLSQPERFASLAYSMSSADVHISCGLRTPVDCTCARVR